MQDNKNISDKLKDCPKIYYFNNDKHIKLKDHMEFNFKSLNIDNYERITTSKYNDKEVSDMISDIEKYKLPISKASYAISVLEFLVNWYENTNEDTLIISRDTIDFGTLEYLPFDWKIMMDNLPYDWDCFLMGFENIHYIPFYLHPVMPSHTFLVGMLNRRYVKKLINLHYKDGKYKLTNYIANKSFGLNSGTVDYFIPHAGKTYCLPIFPNHTDFFNKETKKYALVKMCRLFYYEWWRNYGSKYNMKELFTYGKPNDTGMLRRLINGFNK